MGTAGRPARAREDETCGPRPAQRGKQQAGARPSRGRGNRKWVRGSRRDWPAGHVSQGAGANATAELGPGIRREEGGRAAGTAARPRGNAPRRCAEGYGGPSLGRCGRRRVRARRRKERRTPSGLGPGRDRGGRGGRGLERRCGAGGGTKASVAAIGQRAGVARDAPRGEGARAFSGLFVWCPDRGTEVAAAAALVGFQRPRLALGPAARPFPPPPAPSPPDPRRRRPGPGSDEASATANGDGDAAERAGRGQGPGGRHGELAAVQAVHRRPERADE